MFFPWVGFFEQIKLCDTYVHYNDVQYSKGGFTNRVQVKSPEGSKWLTVPLKKIHLGQPINEVEINNQQNWQAKHLALLRRCYEEAPFYLEMLSLIEGLYKTEWLLIDDLSQASLRAVCRYFSLLESKEFVKINALDFPGVSSERVLDIAKKLGASQYITGHGASKYLDHSLFEDAGIKVEYMDYNKQSYPQMFGEFTPYVSVLDLIANVGMDGVNYINSETKYWKNFVNE
jgi:hypothetical protein